MTMKLKTEAYKVQNEICARIIAADPQRYPAGGLMAQWAQMILEKAETPDETAGPLFKAEEAA